MSPFDIDPSCCPLCGQPNQCAMRQAQATGQIPAPCWCMTEKFSDDLLARVPQAAQNRACICQRCVLEAQT